MEAMADAPFVLAHIGDNFRVWHRPDSRHTGAGEDVQPAVTGSIGTALQQQMQLAQEHHMGSAIVGQQEDTPHDGFEDESPSPAVQHGAAAHASGGRGRTSAAAAAVTADPPPAAAAAAAAAGRSKQQAGATLEELCVTAASVLLGQYRNVQNAL